VGPEALAPVPAARVDDVRTSCGATKPHEVPANARETLLRWNTERFDTGGVHDPCGSELRAPRTGIYLVSAAIEWPAPTEDGARTLAIRRGFWRDVLVADARNVARGEAVQQTISTTVALDAGASVEVTVYTKGAALTLNPGLQTTHATLTFVSP
jgi:hypothetical protein